MDLLTPGIGLIFWQTVVFVMLLLLLGKLAWKPIMASLKEREDFIQDSLNSADKARQEMALLKSDGEKLLGKAREERDRIVREALQKANQLHSQAQGEAKESANKIIEEAKASIDAEKQAALDDIKVQVSLLSLEIAEKLIKQHLSEEGNQKKLIDRFVQDLKVN